MKGQPKPWSLNCLSTPAAQLAHINGCRASAILSQRMSRCRPRFPEHQDSVDGLAPNLGYPVESCLLGSPMREAVTGMSRFVKDVTDAKRIQMMATAISLIAGSDSAPSSRSGAFAFKTFHWLHLTDLQGHEFGIRFMICRECCHFWNKRSLRSFKSDSNISLLPLLLLAFSPSMYAKNGPFHTCQTVCGPEGSTG